MTHDDPPGGRHGRPKPSPESDVALQEASRTAANDAAITSPGDRLREAEVRERARRSAAGLSTAVVACVDAVAARVRRDSPPGQDDEHPTPLPGDFVDEVPPP